MGNGKSNRAQLAEKFIVMLILVLILLVVMFIFEERTFGIWHKQSQKDACKASVMQHALSQFGGIDFLQDINCPTQPIKIAGKDKNAVKREVADAMYECFDQFGQGKYALFSGGSVDSYCVICHVISFDEKNVQIPVSEFADYLATTKVNEKATYADFFVAYTSDYEEMKDIIKNTTMLPDINTQLNYATIFTYTRKGYTTKLFSSSIGATAGLVGGLVATVLTGGGALLVGSVALASGAAGGVIGYEAGSEKAQDWSAGINLIPYVPEQLAGLGCTELPVAQQRLIEQKPQT